MLAAALNMLGRWISGVPWVPFSVGPGDNWTLAEPTVISVTKPETLQFSVSDSRYPKLTGNLSVEFPRGAGQVKFQVTQSKGVITNVDNLQVSPQGDLRSGKSTFGQLRCSEEELQIVRSFLAEKQRAA